MADGEHTAEAEAAPAWHALTIDAVASAVQVSDRRRGLDAEEAARRLLRHGPNRLPAPPAVTLGRIALHQFQSPLIVILLVAAAVAFALDDVVDAGFILVVVLLNALLGTFQEWKAERGAASLQSLIEVRARVRRDGREVSIPASGLVPGDVVLLESGNRVPADMRLEQARDLSVDESFLTGESVAVTKQTDPVAAEVPVADRRSLAFAGSTVVAGRGAGLVVATGVRTEVGHIARTVADTAAVKAPLVLRMERFARQISVVVLVASAVVALAAFAKGMPGADVFFLAVALAVSAIPEGLPVAVTVALSIATTRMARRRVIVRRLSAVEGLGSCTFIASDKTGTLTVNRQTVRRMALPSGEHLAVSGEGYSGEGVVTTDAGEPLSASAAERARRAARAALLSNEATLEQGPDGAWAHSGDAVDVALLALGRKLGLDPAAERDAAQVEGQIPFESERAFAAVAVREDGRVRVLVKGALETLLPRCDTMLTAEGRVPLDAALLEQQAHELSSSGHRFLLVAEAEYAPGKEPATFDGRALPPLCALALVGFIDPPRPEAHEAVRLCRAAGIEVAMVTGDHPLTSFAIAREVGIARSELEIVTGRELEAAAARGLDAVDTLVRGGRVFARVAPLQKLQIVEALRRVGHYVAVTGDGVNDAPALRAANIGVAMGSGSDVTKDTASLIVTDDDFASIEAGVEEGRYAYDNIRKVTYLLVSTGAAEVALVLLSLLLGLPLPLVAAQLLWLNLVTNGIQDVALAFESGEPHAMRRPPRPPREGLFDGRMIRQCVVAGVTMGATAIGFWWWELAAGIEEEYARNRLLLLFVLMQNVHVFNCRSERDSAFSVSLARNRVLALGVPAALGIHLLAMHVPFLQPILRVAPLAPADWIAPIALAFTVLVVMECWKLVERRAQRRAA
ncbi:MAG: HAD-IC family P-type ATPase [Planctomycetes bacterium]|nr:HAD-IC family P-type ATPase [Planctomycetota bacterium]